MARDKDKVDKEQRAADADVEEIAEQQEPADDTPRTDTGLKMHVNSTREEILAKARAKRQQDMKGDKEALDEDGQRLVDAMEAEVRGEAHEFDDEYVEEPESKAADTEPEKPAKEPEAVDSPEEMVTIKVDGEEREVSQSDVMKAGVAAMQKLSTADKRMKEATQYETSVRNLEASVRAQLEELKAMTGQPAAEGQATGDDQANLPVSGAVAEAVKEHAQTVAEAIYAGDQDQVTEGLVAALTSVVQGRQGSTPPLDADKFAEAVMVNMRRMSDEEQAEKVATERANVAEQVNSAFESEFPELYDDDRGFRLTKAEFEHLCSEKPEASRVELMREAAGTVNKLINPPVDDEISRRLARKRGAAANVPETTQRQAPEKPKRTKTRKDVVAEMQRQRGQRAG